MTRIELLNGLEEQLDNLREVNKVLFPMWKDDECCLADADIIRAFDSVDSAIVDIQHAIDELKWSLREMAE